MIFIKTKVHIVKKGGKEHKEDTRDFIIPKNKTNLTLSPFSLFVSFGESGESVKIVRSFFGNGIILYHRIVFPYSHALRGREKQ